jgi:hypothetical protein
MVLVSVNDAAIGLALARGTLTYTEFKTRFFGETWISIADEVGVIEVHPSLADAEAVVNRVKERYPVWKDVVVPVKTRVA